MQYTTIKDTSPQAAIGGKIQKYWDNYGMLPYFKQLRPKLDLPSTLKFQSLLITKKRYGLKDISFGNWLSNEDRFNYINALIIAMYDLNKVLKFYTKEEGRTVNNIGLYGHLSIAFGARGSRGASAHYEPWSEQINITRYKRKTLIDQRPKELRFLSTGGLGAFAHEYGHFLDYFSGSYLDKNNEKFALSGGRSISTSRVGIKGDLRTLTDDILESIIGETHNRTPYYKRLFSFTNATKGHGDYFLRRNEIFARAFEVFVSHELERVGITNMFLVSNKYDIKYYLKDSEMSKLAPLFRKLLSLIREKIK